MKYFLNFVVNKWISRTDLMYLKEITQHSCINIRNSSMKMRTSIRFLIWNLSIFILRNCIPVKFTLNNSLLHFQAPGRPDWLPPAEQPNGVLVHGGLCEAQLPGHQDRVCQHVWAAYCQRPVYGQYSLWQEAHETTVLCPAQFAGRICAEVWSFFVCSFIYRDARRSYTRIPLPNCY